MSISGLTQSYIPPTLDGLNVIDADQIYINGQEVNIDNLVPYTGATKSLNMGSQNIQTTHTAVASNDVVNKALLDYDLANLAVLVDGEFLKKNDTAHTQTVAGYVVFSGGMEATQNSRFNDLTIMTPASVQGWNITASGTSGGGPYDMTFNNVQTSNTIVFKDTGKIEAKGYKDTDATASKVAIFNADKELTSSGVDASKIDYLDNVSSDIQTQLNTKASITYVDSSVAGLASKTYVDAQDATRVLKAGDTITGAINWSGTPSASTHLTTKGYVDSAVATAGSKWTTTSGSNIYNSGLGHVGIGTNSSTRLLNIGQATIGYDQISWTRTTNQPSIEMGTNYFAYASGTGSWMNGTNPGDMVMRTKYNSIHFTLNNGASSVFSLQYPRFISQITEIVASTGASVSYTSTEGTATWTAYPMYLTITLPAEAVGKTLYFTWTVLTDGNKSGLPNFNIYNGGSGGSGTLLYTSSTIGAGVYTTFNATLTPITSTTLEIKVNGLAGWMTYIRWNEISIIWDTTPTISMIGNVGIGTTVPTTKLRVSEGSILLDFGRGIGFHQITTDMASYSIHSVTTAPYALRMTLDADSSSQRPFEIGHYTGNVISGTWNKKFGVNGYNGDTYIAGNLGIRTSAPTVPLDISCGASGTNDNIIWRNDSYMLGWIGYSGGSNDSGALGMYHVGSERVRIRANGPTTFNGGTVEVNSCIKMGAHSYDCVEFTATGNYPNILCSGNNIGMFVSGTGGWITGATNGDMVFRTNNRKMLFSNDLGTSAIMTMKSDSIGVGNYDPLTYMDISKTSAYTKPMLIVDSGTTGSAPQGIGSPLIHIGKSSYQASGGDWYGIGMGWMPSATTKGCVEIGTLITNTAGYEIGDFIIATRPTTTDVVATERVRVMSSGDVSLNGNKLYDCTCKSVFEYQGNWTAGLSKTFAVYRHSTNSVVQVNGYVTGYNNGAQLMSLIVRMYSRTGGTYNSGTLYYFTNVGYNHACYPITLHFRPADMLYTGWYDVELIHNYGFIADTNDFVQLNLQIFPAENF